jgi:hypothetical protein
MKVAFQNLGNSLAPRVLKVVASDGNAAGMSVRDGKLVIEMTKPTRRKHAKPWTNASRVLHA